MKLEDNRLLQLMGLQTKVAQLGLDFEAVLDLVVNESMQILHADGAAIELAEDAQLIYRAANGCLKSFIGKGLEQGLCLSGQALKSRQMQVCNSADDSKYIDVQACRKQGKCSLIAVPLKHQNECVGVLKLCSVNEQAFNDESTGMLELISDMIGASIFYASTYGKQELFVKATTDALTGLGNRALFYERLQNYALLARSKESSFMLVIVDMDDLKMINDNHGHDAGDKAIAETAKRIRGVLKASDTVTRLGGDEFALLIANLPDSGQAYSIIERIRFHVETDVEYEDVTIPINISIGAAIYPLDGEDNKNLLKLADERMYNAKRHRKEKIS